MKAISKIIQGIEFWLYFYISSIYVSMELDIVSKMTPGIYLDRIYLLLNEILETISTVRFSLFTDRCQGCVETFSSNSVSPIILSMYVFIFWLQPYLSLFRGAKDAKYRWLFNWCHRILGQTVFVMGCELTLPLPLAGYPPTESYSGM